MLSPQKSPHMGLSPRTSVPLRGLFLDGVWRCNCPDRPPALRLQTKNHGINHGRWFYRCQRPPQDQCRFFLWASDAEAREKLTVLSNSRSESGAEPQTPSKPVHLENGGLVTPQTDRSVRTAPATGSAFQTPSKNAKARMMAEDTDEFEWDDSITEASVNLLDPPRQPDFGSAMGSRSRSFDESESSPRKTPRTNSLTSPGKRNLSDMHSESSLTPTSVFSSQKNSWHMPPPSAELSLTPTPSKYRNALLGDAREESSELALQVIKILESHNSVVSRRAQEEVTELLNKFDLKTKGIVRGRDISRMAIKKKDEEIRKLQERIANLESQR